MIIALLASNLTLTIYGLTLAQKKFNVNINLKGQLKIYLASALSAIPTLAFKQIFSFTSLPNLVAGATLYLLTYLTLTPTLKTVNEQDLQNLTQIFRNLKAIWPIIKLTLK